ncbi:MAG: M3 family metallopeptidase [Patescibacteria group bacterium]|nr:M3 family metallopeptidase [Patescibacteria group bacterium]
MTEKKATGAEEVRWDLSFLYDGVDDPRIDEDLATLERAAASFRAEFEHYLDTRLGEALAQYAELDSLGCKLMQFTQFVWHSNMKNDAAQTKCMELKERLQSITGDHLTFFEIAVARLDSDVVEHQAGTDKTVRKHLPWIRQQQAEKPHLLSLEVEEALAKRVPFGPDSWDDFWSMTDAGKLYEFEGKMLSDSELGRIMTVDQDSKRRAAVLKALHDGIEGDYHALSTQTLNVIARAGATEDKERKYPSPMAERNMKNLLSQQVVDELHDSVRDIAAPLAMRFYRLKAKILGMKTLRWSDRVAPLPFASDTFVTWDEAVRRIVRAFDGFSPEFGSLVRQMLDKKRIDAPHVKNKRGGAYCSYFCLPGGEPVSVNFLNFLGRENDVMTAAHELGHAMHGLLAGQEQGQLMMDTGMIYAETASIFAEMLLLNQMLEEKRAVGDTKGQLILLAKEADTFINSVVRQISFSNFERRVHAAGRFLSAEEYDRIWMDVTRELYGEDGDVFTYEHVERLWAGIPHFHWPFYVYAYAGGKSFTNGLWTLRDELGDKFPPMFVDLLRAGGTKDANGLLAPFGKKAGREFWDEGARVVFGQQVEEMERLAAQLGYEVD